MSEGKARAQATDASKDETLIIYGDDGETYILTRDNWKKEEFRQKKGNGAVGIIKQLIRLGTYVAYIPPEFAEAVGACCTLVNLKAILAGRGAITGEAGHGAITGEASTHRRA